MARDAGSRWRWVKPGESCAVGPWHLPGGMIYVGTGLGSVSPYRDTEPALIDPRLAAGPLRDRAAVGMGYWPSYSRIGAACRASYLDWLAGGRQDPDAAIGYVFLFLYGLERRMLHDASSDQRVLSELPAVAQEVARLLQLYGDNGSFHGYASRFLDLLRIRGGDRKLLAKPPRPGAGGVPLRLLYALGTMAAEGQPLTPAWALAWVLCHPDTALRTPSQRCREEFVALFEMRFRQRYGDGPVLPRGRSHLRLSYRPASASFAAEVVIDCGGLPDVSRQRKALTELTQLAFECEAAIEPYSRYLGRRPGQGKSLEAAALLPSELLREWGGHDVAGIRDRLAAVAAKAGWAWSRGADLIRWWPSASLDKLAKREHIQVAQLLGKLGYGMEPDPRFGGATLRADQPVVLFRQPDSAPETATPEYHGAALLVRLFVAVAQADGVVDEDERARLAEQIRGNHHLSSAEQARLGAHLRWLIKADLGLAGLSAKLAALTDAMRAELGSFLLSVAAADGVVSPEEVTLLGRLYRLLGLDPEQVHRHLHELAAGGDAERLALLDPGDTASDTWTLPEEAVRDAGVQAVLAGAERLGLLLGAIFDDDEQVEPPPPAVEAEGLPSVAGLDGVHTALLLRLAGCDPFTRADLEAWCEELGLLPDAALDRLNEAAVAQMDTVIVEGDDDFWVDRQTLGEMLDGYL